MEPPSFAIKTPLGPASQVETILAGVAIVIGPGVVGSESVNEMPVIGLAELLVIVSVAVLTLPGPMLLGVNVLESVA